ncbi:RsmD family RNA methyltransferase [Chryseobacterium sp. A301]
MFRIISGRWKGKRIAAPKHFEVRPTTDFAKEALFSILEHRHDLEFLTVLDLFAGIGSISLEFASRDCKDITAVELNPKHCAFINATAAELDMALQINVQRADVYEYLKKNRSKKQFDLIFCDAPFESTDEAQYQKLIDLVLNGDFLKPGGSFILEHTTRLKLQHPSILESRKYGNITFSFLQKPEAASEVESEQTPITEA